MRALRLGQHLEPEARQQPVEDLAVQGVDVDPTVLAAAARAGLRTAYVPRPLEYGPDGRGEAVGDLRFDLVATDFVDLAAQLAA